MVPRENRATRRLGSRDPRPMESWLVQPRSTATQPPDPFSRISLAAGESTRAAAAKDPSASSCRRLRGLASMPLSLVGVGGRPWTFRVHALSRALSLSLGPGSRGRTARRAKNMKNKKKKVAKPGSWRRNLGRAEQEHGSGQAHDLVRREPLQARTDNRSKRAHERTMT